MAYSLCDNIAIHGPFNQHLFMGCSVESFSVSVGLNEQQGELSVQLVEDCASVPDGGNPKIFWDGYLNQQYTYGPDPGFINPGVGSPVYFRMGNFEFSGILQAWTKKDSVDGRPKYSVVIVDPRQILDGAQLIIGNYSGGVGSCYNLINVFGFMEKFGENAVCVPATFEPSCADTYGSALGFGGANINSEGMSSNRIMLGTHLLIGGLNPVQNIFSPFGRLVGKGSSTNGYGIMQADGYDINLYNNFSSQLVEPSAAYHNGYISYYVVDLTELPILPDDFRLGGDSMTIMEFISQICEISSYDFYIELIPVSNGLNTLKVIKVRTINRGSQPILQSLDTYINSNQTIDTSIGNEMRNETTTVFISGANKESMYIFEANDEISTDIETEPTGLDVNEDNCLAGLYDNEMDMIAPYMGLDKNGNVICADKLDFLGKKYYKWRYFDVRGLKYTFERVDISVPTSDVDATPLQTSIDNAIENIDEIDISEAEILFALAGYDSWSMYAASAKRLDGFGTDLYRLVDPLRSCDIQEAFAHAVDLVQPKGLRGKDAVKFRPKPKVAVLPQDNIDVQTALKDNLQKAFNFISKIAENYGTKFMVRVPDTCIRRDSSTGQFVFSQSPVQSAWTDATDVLGIPNPSDFLNIFSTEEGKITPIVRYWNDKDVKKIYDIKELQPDEYGLVDNYLYLTADVEDGYVYYDLNTLCSPRVVISINSKLKRKFDVTETAKVRNAAFGGLIMLMKTKYNRELTAEENHFLAENALKNGAGLPISERLMVPFAVAIPFQSNINRYGPWITAGPPGQIKFEINDDLAPWNYGGSTAMCTAGQLLSDEGVSFQQAVEVGSITVPGFPQWNGGAEFNSVVGGKNLVENRTISTTGFSETAIGDNDPTQIDYVNVPSEAGGAWSGVYGPIITDISVNVGSQGIQTTYSFRTYTAKVGKASKLNSERLKKVGKLNYILNKRVNTLKAQAEYKKERTKRGIAKDGK
jgi:hypothetical protein